MDYQEKIFVELAKLNQKIDSVSSMIRGLPVKSSENLDRWLTEEQTRELMQRGGTSLWDLRKRKKIVSSKIGNRTYYDRESIINYIEKNKVK